MVAAARSKGQNRAPHDDPIVQRTIVQMRHKLPVAAWALDGALAEVGDDPTPSHDRLHAAMAAKAEGHAPGWKSSIWHP